MKIKSIKIEFIPHSSQRYETVGDWIMNEDGNHVIRISNLKDERYSWLVGFHELAEFLLCLNRGITQEEVDAFDKNYEEERKNGKHLEDDEPGDDLNAPYKNEHFFATSVERLLSSELGVDWNEYDDSVMSL